MTARQAQLLAFIEDYINANGGRAPSYDQMAEALGLRSKSGIHRIISGLEERGYITRRPRSWRAIRIQAAPVTVDQLDSMVRSLAASEGVPRTLDVLRDLYTRLAPSLQWEAAP